MRNWLSEYWRLLLPELAAWVKEFELQMQAISCRFLGHEWLYKGGAGNSRLKVDLLQCRRCGRKDWLRFPQVEGRAND